MSRRVLESCLQEWNYRVTAVDNGLDAWSLLQQPDAPQMVILDWMMPGLDGIELCRRIRSHRTGSYKYVLLLTARGSKEDIVAGLEAGADNYLTKPFELTELRARLRPEREFWSCRRRCCECRPHCNSNRRMTI